jgi:TATA-box binding protein (TBP) (component of TFIID and TFIIIB)
MADPYQPLKFTNIVGVATINHLLDLVGITEDLQARFENSIFPASVSNCMESQSNLSIFHKGSLVVTSEAKYQCLLGVLEFVSKIRRDFGLHLSYFNFTITNIVADCKLGYQINRNLFYHKHKKYCLWKPEVFDGLFYRTLNPDITFVVSKNGSIIATGLPTIDSLPMVEDRLNIFKPFELGKEYTELKNENFRERYDRERNNYELYHINNNNNNEMDIDDTETERKNWNTYVAIQMEQEQFHNEREKQKRSLPIAPSSSITNNNNNNNNNNQPSEEMSKSFQKHQLLQSDPGAYAKRYINNSNRHGNNNNNNIQQKKKPQPQKKLTTIRLEGPTANKRNNNNNQERNS